MKISFNAPVVLIFTLLAVIVLGITEWISPTFTPKYFVSTGHFDWGNGLDYFRLLSHAIGHANWQHLVGNFSFILLIGPILEEKYGSKNLLIMMIFTAVITGILNNATSDVGLLGASGIVFMMILLGSLVNLRSGTIPLTFIFIVVLYLGQEVYDAFFKEDQVSQFGHIIGGICGMLFGFFFNNQKVPVKVTK